MIGFEDDNGKYRNHDEGISRNGKKDSSYLY